LKERESKLTEPTSARDAQAEQQNREAELRAEIEQLKEMQNKIAKLTVKLAEFVPRDMLELLRNEVNILAEKTNRLEATVTERLEKLNSTEARTRDLELKLRERESEMKAFRNRIKKLEATQSKVSVASDCPNCRQPTFPGDIYCGNCGVKLPGRGSVTPTSPLPTVESGSTCPTCGYKKPDASFRGLSGTPPSHAPPQRSIVPRAVLVMPDQTEISISGMRRVFGRNDLMKYLKPENVNTISNAQFTITWENNDFYLRDGGPDPENFTIVEENGIYYVQDDKSNPQAWRPSVYGTIVNGVLLQPGAKKELNHNDVIDVSRLVLNLTFKISKPR